MDDIEMGVKYHWNNLPNLQSMFKAPPFHPDLEGATLNQWEIAGTFDPREMILAGDIPYRELEQVKLHFQQGSIVYNGQKP